MTRVCVCVSLPLGDKYSLNQSDRVKRSLMFQQHTYVFLLLHPHRLQCRVFVTLSVPFVFFCLSLNTQLLVKIWRVKNLFHILQFLSWQLSPHPWSTPLKKYWKYFRLIQARRIPAELGRLQVYWIRGQAETSQVGGTRILPERHLVIGAEHCQSSWGYRAHPAGASLRETVGYRCKFVCGCVFHNRQEKHIGESTKVSSIK